MTDKYTGDGGPAYPWGEHGTRLGGATLRDAFAGDALTGLCANPGGPFQSNGMNGWSLVNCTLDEVATTAYDLADAMLRARMVAT